MTRATLRRAAPLMLPAGIVAPGYDLGAVTSGIVHIGLGGFHRAHLARYTHDLMQLDRSALGWGIIGSGLREGDAALLAALERQDGLYTLVERDAAGETCTVIGSIVGAIDAAAGAGTLLDAIARPGTRIVSITVTERGYHLGGAAKTLDLASAAIRRDAANPRAPRTMPGILVEAFRRRRDAGQPAFTALSCDNIQHNGRVLRGIVLALAEQSDPGLAEWIAERALFPNSMVDRITPVPTADDIAAFGAATGLADQATVFAETFRQWVIEDRFVAGRPDWDRVGAQFVADVEPYEAMKLRLLNASHLAIAGLGSLLGYGTIVETINDPLIRRYMVRLMDRETGPTLRPVPGIALALYKATLIERFANPSIRDTVQRVNTDAPVNLLLDPLRDRLAADASIDLLSLGLAAWCRRVRDEAGRDASAGQAVQAESPLHARARAGGDDPTALLSIGTLFGRLAQDMRLVASVRLWLTEFTEHGVAGALVRAGARDAF